NMATQTITFPSTADGLDEIKQGFYATSQFPHVIGVIDCTHVQIKTPSENEVRWCCVNDGEYNKCQMWREAVMLQNFTLSKIGCIRGRDKYDCYRKIFNDEADLMNADSGEVNTAGRYYNLVPIMNELLNIQLFGGPSTSAYYAVAVVRRGSQVSLNNLQGARSCHSSVGSTAGWNIPISQLLRDKRLNIIDCNNHVKSAALLFGEMCAPDALNRQFNPTGDNPASVCELCQGLPGVNYCTNQDPYAGNIGALYCLANKGDIAFVRHTSLLELQQLDPTFPLDQFELLCPMNNQRASWQNYQQCNWGISPANAILVSHRRPKQLRDIYKQVLIDSANIFTFQNPIFQLFNSRRFNGYDLLFSDIAVGFNSLNDKTTYATYLGNDYTAIMSRLYDCPLRVLRWCVLSPYEKEKCRLMKNAFTRKNVKPDLDCISAKNAMECMSKIKQGIADIITLDSADAFRATRYYDLIPLAAEDYGVDLETNVMYAVAVAKRTDLTTNLWNLRGKTICSTAVGDLAGWHIPVDYLTAIRELFVQDCHVNKVAGEYFGRSCVPGALDYDYNKVKTNPRALCLKCYSKGSDYCSRSQREMFYGNSGAFRCLTEGTGGHVAFVMHTAVISNTDGRNVDQWSRPLRAIDFELLCKNGTRKTIDGFKSCHMAKVPARVLMTASSKSDLDKLYIWNMLNFAQQLFGSDTNKDFPMFDSFYEHPDLLFLDSTVQLTRVTSSIEDYLGQDIIQMLIRTDPRMCNLSINLSSTHRTIFFLFILVSFLQQNI
ncbi:unnamed protein product, partial [Didymodactylos carnosus]